VNEPSANGSGSLDQALAHASRLLTADKAALAEEQAREILKVVPGHPVAELYLGAALRKQEQIEAALAILEPLARSQPNASVTHLELGLALGAAGRGVEALAALERAVAIKPDLAEAWRALADHLHATGETEAADDAYARFLSTANRDPKLMAAASALVEKRVPVAETLLRDHLKQHPTDVAAIRMLAEVAARLGRNADAELLLRRCLELAPSFAAARQNLAMMLHRQNKLPEALAEAESLLARNPRQTAWLNLKAVILSRLGENAAAIDAFEKVLAQYRRAPKVWMSYGHTLKTAGRQADSIAAYRQALTHAPGLGEAWWSLANLKTFRFEAADIATIRAQLARSDLAGEDRLHLDFALGKALEDAGEYEQSFRHYAAGNELRRRSLRYSADDNRARVVRSRELFTPEFFAERAGWGAPHADPIFVVGLPRSGSTLVEQILASHSQIEGTMELPDIMGFVRELGARLKRSDPSRYPQVLAELTEAQCRGLGERYIAQTRVQRKLGRPFFIDKMPNNFAHSGLIHLILPNARIVDARRHPLGCCFSGFKQHFARGQSFTYSLEDIGRYYRDYVELMAHMDAVLPGRVHRVIYEEMVADTEAQVRDLLRYCNVPFEDSCLRFFENERAVRTASSEQVRQPIFREGVDHWRHFEPWLGPLKAALGPALESYPAAPPL